MFPSGYKNTSEDAREKGVQNTATQHLLRFSTAVIFSNFQMFPLIEIRKKCSISFRTLREIERKITL